MKNIKLLPVLVISFVCAATAAQAEAGLTTWKAVTVAAAAPAAKAPAARAAKAVAPAPAATAAAPRQNPTGDGGIKH